MTKFWGRQSHGYKSVRGRIVKFVRTRQLLHAARNNHIGLMRILVLNERVGVDRQDGLGQTALHKAVENGHLEMARFLLEEGAAAVTYRDSSHRSALHIAVEEADKIDETSDKCKNAKRLIILLMEKGAEVEVADSSITSPWKLTTKEWILDLRKLNILVAGPSKTDHSGLKDPETPNPGSDAFAACAGFLAHRVGFYSVQGQENFFPKWRDVYELIYGGSLDAMPHAEQVLKCQWYHLPANNVCGIFLPSRQLN
jgi:hypothetical protein